MNRTIRAAIAVIFILVITFSTISICQNIGKRIKLDVTQEQLYTLSSGTKAILARLDQPVKVKLYYSRTASMKAPDNIKYFNNYYEYVRALLDEYAAVSNGKVQVQVIDPRPFSDDEVDAIRYGLKKFPITQEENFFFGLVLQTRFGVEKVIPFFSPDRQNFIEYDISRLIDTAITRQKKKIGILSSLPVMGENISPYMAQMMQMQGQQPKAPWTFVQQLRQQYDVTEIPKDTNDINNIDTLLVIHPKKLPEQTRFAIDQYILKGGRTIICIDPYCFADQPGRAEMQMQGIRRQNSNLPKLLSSWGLQMPDDTFVGDRDMAMSAPLGPNQRLEKLIGLLHLSPPDNFNPDNVATAELNSVRVLFAGALKKTAEPNTADPNIHLTPLLTTTNRGNTFTVSSPFELRYPDPGSLMKKFTEGTKPVTMAYMITGKLPSAFPNGIDVEVKTQSKSKESDKTAGDKSEAKAKTVKRHIAGLARAGQDCAVIVFSDVDFLSDMLAYQNTIFGKLVVGDNGALLMNAIDELGGSSELISIRSKGGLRRPFTVVDKIEAKAEAESAEEVQKINAEIDGFEAELRKLVSASKDQQKQIVGSTIVQKTRDLELKKLKARRRLREVKMQRRQRIEHLGNILRNFNMLLAPAVILIIAIVLGIRRAILKKHYISHASDA